MKKWIAVLILFVSTAHGAPADLLADKNISQSFQRLSQDEDLDRTVLRTLYTAWDKKCADLEYPKIAKCYLNECDMNIPSCKTSNVLLFRGENKKYPYMGTSPLLRNTLNGLEFGASAKNPTELLSSVVQLAKNAQLDRDQIHDNHSLVLISEDGKYAWHDLPDASKDKSYSEIIDMNLRKTSDGKSEKLGTFFYDAQSLGGSMLSVLDPKLNIQDISILVSLTADPQVAECFADGKKGESRLIVLSVPKSEIKDDCAKIYGPGVIAKYNQCIQREGDETQAMEVELNATLFIAPQYILKSFRL